MDTHAPYLRRVTPQTFTTDTQEAVDQETLAAARAIVDRVRTGGEGALRDYAERFGDREPGEPLIYRRDALDAARDAIDTEDREVLERRPRIRVPAHIHVVVRVEAPNNEAGIASIERLFLVEIDQSKTVGFNE